MPFINGVFVPADDDNEDFVFQELEMQDVHAEQNIDNVEPVEIAVRRMDGDNQRPVEPINNQHARFPRRLLIRQDGVDEGENNLQNIMMPFWAEAQAGASAGANLGAGALVDHGDGVEDRQDDAEEDINERVLFRV